MSSQLFPSLPGFDINVKRTPLFSTGIQAAPSGKELRASWWAFPKWQYDLTLNFVRQAGFSAQTLIEEAGTLVTFHAQHLGKWDSFLFQDPYDSSDTAMGFGVGDGTTTVFQLQRREPGQYSNVLGTYPVPTTPRTNLLLQSGFAAGWSSLITNSTATAAPDGNPTARYCTWSATSYPQITGTFQVVAGQTYTLSVWVKHDTPGVPIGVVSNAGNLALNVSTQSTGGWQRITATGTATGTGAASFVVVLNNSGATTTAGCAVYAPQAEVGSTATDYIPTTIAAVTVNPSYYPGTDGFEPVTEPAPGVQIFRQDWQGSQLLYSTSRTNLCLQSASFPTTWTLDGFLAFGSGSVSDATTAPDGSPNADKLFETATTAMHRTYQSVTCALGNYTFSACIKAVGRTWAFLVISDGTTGSVGARINLTTGAVTLDAATIGSWTNASVSAVPLANGWWRVTVSGTRNAGTICTCGIYASDGVGTASSATYLGLITSGIYVWGAQLEAGTLATSYTPTAATAVSITDYTQATGGVVTFAQPPLAGAALTWTGGYYRRVRFDDDSLTLERIVNLAWKGGSIRLVSTK